MRIITSVSYSASVHRRISFWTFTPWPLSLQVRGLRAPAFEVFWGWQVFTGLIQRSDSCIPLPWIVASPLPRKLSRDGLPSHYLLTAQGSYRLCTTRPSQRSLSCHWRELCRIIRRLLEIHSPTSTHVFGAHNRPRTHNLSFDQLISLSVYDLLSPFPTPSSFHITHHSPSTVSASAALAANTYPFVFLPKSSTRCSVAPGRAVVPCPDYGYEERGWSLPRML